MIGRPLLLPRILPGKHTLNFLEYVIMILALLTDILYCKRIFFIYPIRTVFPSNANPYFLIRSAVIPFASSTAEYCFSSI